MVKQDKTDVLLLNERCSPLACNCLPNCVLFFGQEFVKDYSDTIWEVSVVKINKVPLRFKVETVLLGINFRNCTNIHQNYCDYDF